MSKICRQKNGNYTFILYSDGTKFREDVAYHEPLFPETMDVKITNYCDAGCYFCHENSTREGRHGELNSRYWVNCGVQEIAIGGGNPLSHPRLDGFLREMKELGKVCNITVNSFHAQRSDVSQRLFDLRESGLIQAVGISYHPVFFPKVEFKDENMVVHFILGIHSVDEVRRVIDGRRVKILLLGYKTFGRGAKYPIKDLQDWKKEWRQLPAESISLDNLAIKQLEVETENDTNYLGEEGKFSMYVDLVEKQVALSSYSPERFPMTDCIEDFKTMREMNGLTPIQGHQRAHI